MVNKITSPQIAVIGCGAWGKNLVRNFHQLESLGAVVDNDSVVCQALYDEYGLAASTFEEVLENENIQGVVIALASKHHFNATEKALRAGKHVYVEKPLTLSYEDSRELCELSKSLDRKLMVGHLPRYHPGFQKLAELVHKGEIGEKRYIYSHRLNLGRIRRDENCLWDLAPHDLSMVLAISDQEPESTATHVSSNLEKGIDDTAIVNFTFPDGTKGHIFNSWMHPIKEHRFVVIGSKGMVVFDDTKPWENKLSIYHHRIDKMPDENYVTEYRDAVFVPLEVGEPLKLECKHFLDCIASNQEPLTGASEALRVMKILEAIQP